MKTKYVVLSSILVFSILFTGCGKKDKKEVLYTDDGISVVGGQEQNLSMENIEYPTVVNISQEEKDMNLSNVDKLDYEVLNKDLYDEYMNSLPVDDNGVVDIANLTAQQKEIYDKFQNGVYITNFSADEVLTDVLDFFSDTNLDRINTVKYVESVNKTITEDETKTTSYNYKATVYDDFGDKVIDGKLSFRDGTDFSEFTYDYILNYFDNYVYGYFTLDEKSVYFDCNKLTKTYENPLVTLQNIVNNGISNFQIKTVNSDVYECTFDVDATLFDKSNIADRSYIENVFTPDTSKTVTGQIWVDYNINRITTIVFTQIVNDKQTNMVSFGFENYNKPEYDDKLDAYLSYEDAKDLRDFIVAKQEANRNDPSNLTPSDANTDEKQDEQQEEDEETKKKHQEEAEHIWDNVEAIPDGCTPLLDGMGKKVKDINGKTIFVYKDTFVPYDPTQIPEGMDTPIGSEPIIGARLLPPVQPTE